MITFIGDFVCKPDAKGRIVLPSLFKKSLESEGQQCFVIQKDLFENCLVMVPHEEWLNEVKFIESKLSGFRQKDKQLKRALFRGTAEVNLDANGRFLIPKRLSDMIGVDGEVVLLGVGSRIEVWNKQTFDADEMSGDELGDLAEELLGKDFVGGD